MNQNIQSLLPFSAAINLFDVFGIVPDLFCRTNKENASNLSKP